MRRVLTEQVLYLSYVMQINMHGQHVLSLLIVNMDNIIDKQVFT